MKKRVRELNQRAREYGVTNWQVFRLRVFTRPALVGWYGVVIAGNGVMIKRFWRLKRGNAANAAESFRYRETHR